MIATVYPLCTVAVSVAITPERPSLRLMPQQALFGTLPQRSRGNVAGRAVPKNQPASVSGADAVMGAAAGC